VKVDRRKWKGVCGGVANALIATRCAIIAQRFARMCSQRKTHIYIYKRPRQGEISVKASLAA